MIRMRPFDKVSYNKLREGYLEQLGYSKAVAYDVENNLDITDRLQKDKTLNIQGLLDKPEYKYDKLKDFLYLNGNIRRDHLQLLLAGPEDAPASLGGNGSYDSLRQYFEDMINRLGIPEEDSEIKACKMLFRYRCLNYKKKGQKESTAYWLQQQLGVKVCPYCNRMYTTTLFGENRIRPDFDHFYPQSKYPYLAVSLFNLIPSCNICNRKKSDTAEIYHPKEKSVNKSIIYPYDESFDDSQGHISFRVISHKKEAMTGQSDEFAIELQPSRYSDKLEFQNTGGVLARTDVRTRFDHKIKVSLTDQEKDVAKREAQFWARSESSITLLLIENFYNEYKDEIMALLRNHYQYNKDSIEFIMKTSAKVQYPNAEERDVRLLTRSMLYFAFLQPEEWGNTPLNKLKSDILEQLDAIENTHIDFE